MPRKPDTVSFEDLIQRASHPTQHPAYGQAASEASRFRSTVRLSPITVLFISRQRFETVICTLVEDDDGSGVDDGKRDRWLRHGELAILLCHPNCVVVQVLIVAQIVIILLEYE